MNVEKSHLDSVLQAIANDILPSNMSLYRVDGKALFELRGESGGISSSLVYYIVQDKPMVLDKDGNNNYARYCGKIPINVILSFNYLNEHIHTSLFKFQTHLTENFHKVKTFNPDGGDLGLEN